MFIWLKSLFNIAHLQVAPYLILKKIYPKTLAPLAIGPGGAIRTLSGCGGSQPGYEYRTEIAIQLSAR
jgi:hypothetical protein